MLFSRIIFTWHVCSLTFSCCSNGVFSFQITRTSFLTVCWVQIWNHLSCAPSWYRKKATAVMVNVIDKTCAFSTVTNHTQTQLSSLRPLTLMTLDEAQDLGEHWPLSCNCQSSDLLVRRGPFVLHNSAVTDTHGAPTQVILVFSAARLRTMWVCTVCARSTAWWHLYNFQHCSVHLQPEQRCNHPNRKHLCGCAGPCNYTVLWYQHISGSCCPT